LKIGLIPLGMKCRRLTTNGLRWNLKGDDLAFGGLISSSNEVVNSPVRVETSDPILWTCDFR